MKSAPLDLSPVRILARRHLSNEETELNGKLLSTTEAGDLLGVSIQTIIAMFDSGKISGRRIGNRRKIHMSEVRRLQEEWQVHRGVMDPKEALRLLQLRNYTDLYRLCRQGELTTFSLNRESRYHADRVQVLRKKWGMEAGTQVFDIATVAQLFQCHRSHVYRAVKPNAPASFIKCLSEQQPQLTSNTGRGRHRFNDYAVWHAMMATEQAPPVKIVRLSPIPKHQKTYDVPMEQRIILPARNGNDLAEHLERWFRSIVMIVMDPKHYEDDQHADLKHEVERFYAKQEFPVPSVPTLKEIAAIEKANLYPPDPPKENAHARSRTHKRGRRR